MQHLKTITNTFNRNIYTYIQCSDFINLTGYIK